MNLKDSDATTLKDACPNIAEMAGRGRGRGGYGERDGPLRRPGEPAVSRTTAGKINITTLIGKIQDINIFDIDPLLLHETEVLFKRLFTTGEDVKDILSNLHSQAVNDSVFGAKLVIALEQVCTFEVDNVCVRSQWLKYIQEDHGLKETMCRSDSRKFANVVSLLGNVYNVFKVGGEPIRILGQALIDYFDLIVRYDDEMQFQVLATQVILNGNQITKAEDAAKRFESLKQSLRKALIKANLGSKARCWLLLAVDYISNNLKPLHGVVRDFYIENLGDEYLQLESRLTGTNPTVKLPKAQVSLDSKYETGSIKSNKSEDFFDVIDNLSITSKGSRGMSTTKVKKPEQELYSLRRGRYEEAQISAKKDGSKTKISTERRKSPKSEDDFYGIQIEKKVQDK